MILCPLGPKRLTALWLLFSAAVESLLFGTLLTPGHLSYHMLVSNASPLRVTPFRTSYLWHFSVCWKLGTACCRNNRRVKDESYRLGLGVWETAVISVMSVSVVYLGREGKESRKQVGSVQETQRSYPAQAYQGTIHLHSFGRLHQRVASWTGHRNLAQMPVKQTANNHSIHQEVNFGYWSTDYLLSQHLGETSWLKKLNVQTDLKLHGS